MTAIRVPHRGSTALQKAGSETDRAIQLRNGVIAVLPESFPILIKAADSFQNTSRNDINLGM